MPQKAVFEIVGDPDDPAWFEQSLSACAAASGLEVPEMKGEVAGAGADLRAVGWDGIRNVRPRYDVPGLTRAIYVDDVPGCSLFFDLVPPDGDLGCIRLLEACPTSVFAEGLARAKRRLRWLIENGY